MKYVALCLLISSSLMWSIPAWASDEAAPLVDELAERQGVSPATPVPSSPVEPQDVSAAPAGWRKAAPLIPSWAE